VKLSIVRSRRSRKRPASDMEPEVQPLEYSSSSFSSSSSSSLVGTVFKPQDIPSLDDIPPEVKDCFPHPSIVVCNPVPGEGKRRGIIAALCPPAKTNKDKPYDNKTCYQLYQILWHYWFIFIDLFPIATGDTHEEVNQETLLILVLVRNVRVLPLLLQWFHRIVTVVMLEHEAGNPLPVVI